MATDQVLADGPRTAEESAPAAARAYGWGPKDLGQAGTYLGLSGQMIVTAWFVGSMNPGEPLWLIALLLFPMFVYFLHRENTPARVVLAGVRWVDVRARVTALLSRTGHSIQGTEGGLRADLVDSFAPHFAFDVSTEGSDLVLTGPKGRVRRVCRAIGARGPGYF